jgi:WD40 repeat protein
LSADGALLAAESYADRDVHLLHTTTREVLTRYRCDAFVTELAFSPAGQVLAAALVNQSYKSGTVDLWTMVTDPASRIRLAGMDSPIAQLTFSPDARFLAAAAEPGRHEGSRQVRLWDVASAQPGSPIEAAGQVAMVFSPDSRWFAMSCADHAVRLWDMRSPSPELDLTDPDPHEGRPLLAFSPTASHLATTTRTGVRLWALP